MSEFGHVKMSRKAYLPLEQGGDPFWNEERVFSRWEAWEYLIQIAAYSDHKRLAGGHVVEIARGHTPPLAISFLASAWGWSSKRVRIFLATLVEMDRIRAVAGARTGTVYLILNYDYYQSAGTEKGTLEGTEGARKGHAEGRERAGTRSSKAVKQVSKDPSIHPSARPLDEEERISFVIRLANRGMNENDAIDPYRLRPILPQDGTSRQAIADWRAAGVDWSTIEATVYDRATKYRPSDRYHQIQALTYFSRAVLDAHERQVAMQIDAPSIGEESDDDLLRHVPAELREWAERVDAKLRTDDIGRAEAEKVRENLRRLNEQEIKRMRSTEAEAYVWIRLLKWYGERIGDPRPGRNAA